MEKRFTYIFCFVLMLFLSVQIAEAQNGTDRILIKGKITDSRDKLSIIGASVVEQDNDKRTINGVATDLDGNFAIRVQSTKNKLSVSYIGYKTKIFDINDRRTFNVSIESNSNALNEVSIVSSKAVSNGSGLNIEKRNQTTAIATISGKELEELQSSSIDQALQGRLPGVDITANSGDPGAGMSIRIRGTSTINGATNPLVVVDGIPYETTIPQDFNFATADEQGYASLLSIAPSDILTISVLKDAAATAVWGSRAANGVLIITTKRGAVGAPSVTYTFKGSLSKQPSAVPLLTGNQYSQLIPEEVQNVAGTPLNTLNTREFRYDPNDSYYYYNYSNNTDWLKAITQTGFVNNHNVSISGGGEKARYFASLGYDDERGTTVGTGLNRINARFNLDYIVSDKLTFRADVAYSHSLTKSSYSPNPLRSDLTIRNIAFNKMPNMSIYEYDEYGNQTPNYFSPAQNIQGQYPGTYNPVAMANTASNTNTTDRVTPHFNLQYRILPELLTATADVQFDVNNSLIATFLPQIATGRPITETVVNRAYNYDFDVFNVQSKINFIATPKLGDKQSFQGLLSLQTYDNKILNQSQLTSNTATDLIQNPSAPSRTQNQELGIASGLAQTRTVAALLSAQYGLLDRYLVNVGLRGDGNSRFGPGNRYGLFPSVSTRWRVSGEPFMKRFKLIDDFSFRASYGQSGNAPTRDYSFYNLYNNFNWTYLGQSGIYSSNIQLDNLRFEKTTGTNLGLNLIMFKSRFNLDVEVYRNRTTNLLFNALQIPSFNGYGTISQNGGTLDNQGYEIGLNFTPLRTKKWTIDVAFNMAHNENVIRSISQFVSVTTGNTTVNGQYLATLQPNNPLGSVYGYRYLGVYKDASQTIATDASGKQIIGPTGQPVQMRFNYPQTDYLFQAGDAKYDDINHDGVIDYRDVIYLGNGNPKITGGFGPTISYQGKWRLNAFFSYRYGFDLVNNTMITTTNMYDYNNQSTAVLRRWRQPGDETDIPRALYRSGYNWLGSSRYVQDGSFIKLTSLTLRYTLDQSFTKKLNIKSASIYATGQNLYTWTRYLGQDPEVSPRSSDIYRQSIDNSTTPASKIYTLGLTTTF
ncbi:MAG: SusC/RagA family TonB-linked outer membrane protein [Sphingobacteriaceae bacterium]|nr:MAG: SusC/RagA family TonB-linked outer membrane protein [Sphingobacteriaceae bacterium]